MSSIFTPNIIVQSPKKSRIPRKPIILEENYDYNDGKLEDVSNWSLNNTNGLENYVNNKGLETNPLQDPETINNYPEDYSLALPVTLDHTKPFSCFVHVDNVIVPQNLGGQRYTMTNYGGFGLTNTLSNTGTNTSLRCRWWFNYTGTNLEPLSIKSYVALDIHSISIYGEYFTDSNFLNFSMNVRLDYDTKNKKIILFFNGHKIVKTMPTGFGSIVNDLKYVFCSVAKSFNSTYIPAPSTLPNNYMRLDNLKLVGWKA